jgi:hypothetical protein
MKYLQIDRFEGDYAVCIRDKDLAIVNLDKKLLSPQAAEGDVLLFKESEYVIDMEETQKRKDEALKLFQSLIHKEPGD